MALGQFELSLYTDPVANSPADDNPIRWLGFLLNPIGVLLVLWCQPPTLFSGGQLSGALWIYS